MKDLLGQGTFGQVVRCVEESTGEPRFALAAKLGELGPAYSR